MWRQRTGSSPTQSSRAVCTLLSGSPRGGKSHGPAPSLVMSTTLTLCPRKAPTGEIATFPPPASLCCCRRTQVMKVFEKMSALFPNAPGMGAPGAFPTTPQQ